ncbi:MAG: hypothetical protein Ctma_0436 [Catillopecten margaritatus gill symbiont]|uniref:Plasmid stabilization protein n=1 Tax=Catillopecten margaritatus gill symbiont TaxID=3083288 RepID=A0AAU6PFE7_9GAMM
MKYLISWSESAIKDLNDLSEYITVIDNKDIAEKTFEGIILTVNDLNFFPERGRNVDEIKEFGGLDFKFLLYKRWKIIYKIYHELEAVSVLLVVDTSMDLQNILDRMIIDEKLNRY